MSAYSLICCVVNYGDATKTIKTSRKYGVTGGVILHGKGTVNAGKVMNFLGFTEERKEIVMLMTEEPLASETLLGISHDMNFFKPHHGIAFSHSVSDYSGKSNETDGDTSDSKERNIMYSAIYVVVNRGMAEEVIEAASKAGAGGGTIINARGAGRDEVQRLFSLDIEPEKEVVLILVKKESRENIVGAIRIALRIDEPNRGIMFVLDVDEVYGLRKE